MWNLKHYLFTALLLVRTHKDMFTQVSAAFHKYWDYTGFMTNSFLFFLIGIPLSVRIPDFLWHTITCNNIGSHYDSNDFKSHYSLSHYSLL